MADKITGTVGKKGRNNGPDVTVVQELLNKHKSAGGYAALKVDGMIGKKTIGALESFQRKVLAIRSDGRVKPNDETFIALVARPGSAGPGNNGEARNGVGTAAGAIGEKDEEADALPGPEELRKLVRKTTRSAMLFAFAVAGKPEECVLYLKRKGNPKKVGEFLKKETGLSKVAFGRCHQDLQAKDTLVFDLAQKRPIPGLAKKGSKFLKARKLMPYKQVKIMIGGQEVADDAGDDANENSAGAESRPQGNREERSRRTKVPSDLSGSVGLRGANKPDDVTAVQTLLNDHGATLEVDGKVGRQTIKAIGVFQKKNNLIVDGRVDPGGATWQALNGGSTPAGGGTARSGGGTKPQRAGRGDDTGGSRRPSREAVSDDIKRTGGAEADGAGRKGSKPWFDAEVELQSPIGSIKIATNSKGEVTGGAIVGKPAAKVGGREQLAGPYYVGAEIKALSKELSFTGTGPKVQATGTISSSGTIMVGMGAAKKDSVIGVEGQIELSGSTAAFSAEVDLDHLSFEWTGPRFPLEIPLKGELKAALVAEKGDWGGSATVPIKTYDKIVIATVDRDFNFSVRPGPGLDQIEADIDAAIKFAEEHPEAGGTGATPFTPEEMEDFGEEPADEGMPKAEKGGMKNAGDMGQRAIAEQERKAREAAIRECRTAEDQMRAAFQAGWKDPNLLGKANALAQQDEAMAREIYGNAWTQRALAKTAHDQYSSPLDSSPINIIQARTAQAHDIAQKFFTVVGMFQNGDASW